MLVPENADQVITEIALMLGLHVVGVGVARSTTWMYNRARNAGAVVAHVSKQLPIKKNFVNETELLKHFNKHAGEFKGVYKTPEEYLEGANFLIENGHSVKYLYNGKIRTRYVRFMGNTRSLAMDDVINNVSKRKLGLSKDHKFGEAKFEFLSVRDDGSIATYHVKHGRDFYKTLNQSEKANEVNVDKLSCKIM